ncbi:MAG: hypothetical protein R3E39_27620 [Anaerolineae bacterium]
MTPPVPVTPGVPGGPGTPGVPPPIVQTQLPGAVGYLPAIQSQWMYAVCGTWGNRKVDYYVV